MLVATLSPRSGRGVGTFQTGLLGAATLPSAMVSGLLRVGVPLSVLMIAALGLPTFVAVALHRAAEPSDAETQ